MDQPDHVLRNRILWDTQAPDWVEGGRRGWGEHELTWGVWHIPEAHVRALPPVRDRDVVELGSLAVRGDLASTESTLKFVAGQEPWEVPA